MSVRVAFLRGINLGKRRLKMAELRGHLDDLGLEDVATFLASGNVAFRHGASDAAAVEAEIEEHLERALGYPVDTFVRPLARLAELVALDAVADGAAAGFNPHAIFLKEPADADARAALAGLEGDDDRFHVLEREVVWLRRGGLSDAPISPRDLERALGGRTSTQRTMSTVERIVEKFG